MVGWSTTFCVSDTGDGKAMRKVLGKIPDYASAAGFLFLMAVAASEMTAGAYLAVLATGAAVAVAVILWGAWAWRARVRAAQAGSS